MAVAAAADPCRRNCSSSLSPLPGRASDLASRPSEVALVGRRRLRGRRPCRGAGRPYGRELLESLVRAVDDGVALRDGLPAPDADVGIGGIKLQAVGAPADLL